MSITMQLLPDVSAMRELYSSRFQLTIYSWQVVFQLTVPGYYSSTGTELCCLGSLSRFLEKKRNCEIFTGLNRFSNLLDIFFRAQRTKSSRENEGKK